MTILNFVSIAGNSIISILVNEKHTILDIKTFLIDKKLTSVYGLLKLPEVSIIYKDSVLDYYKTVSECEFEEDSVVTLIVKKYDQNEKLTQINTWVDFHFLENIVHLHNLQYPSWFTIKEAKLAILEQCRYKMIMYSNLKFIACYPQEGGKAFKDDDAIIGDIKTISGLSVIIFIEKFDNKRMKSIEHDIKISIIDV